MGFIKSVEKNGQKCRINGNKNAKEMKIGNNK